MTTEEEDIVIGARDIATLGATSFSDNAVFVATRMVGPSGPPVVTDFNGTLSNLATERIELKVVVNQHLVISAIDDADVVDVELGSGSILGRIEIHGIKFTANGIRAKAVKAPHPRTHFLFGLASDIPIKGGQVLVHVDVHSVLHPLVIHTRDFDSAVATSMNGTHAFTKSSGIVTIVGAAEIELGGPSRTTTSKLMQHIEIAILSIRNESIENEIEHT